MVKKITTCCTSTECITDLDKIDINIRKILNQVSIWFDLKCVTSLYVGFGNKPHLLTLKKPVHDRPRAQTLDILSGQRKETSK